MLTKLHIQTRFPVLEKIVDLMKDLKYEHQSILSLWGGSNLILGIGRENQIISSENSSHCQVFSQNCQMKAMSASHIYRMGQNGPCPKCPQCSK